MWNEKSKPSAVVVLVHMVQKICGDYVQVVNVALSWR
jgi:hypothetical protein